MTIKGRLAKLTERVSEAQAEAQRQAEAATKAKTQSCLGLMSLDELYALRAGEQWAVDVFKKRWAELEVEPCET
ncbi:MAG: hypothetical protein R3C14_54300 [Caldilineaceae bacterium]